MNDIRYMNIGCEVWDLAWSDPATGTWTAGLPREAVVVRYPSVQAAYEAAESLNSNMPRTSGEALARFTAGCEAAIAEKEARDNLPQPREDWLDGIDLSDL